MALFSERLRLLRKERGLSQQDLSNQLRLIAGDIKGISKSSVNMLERGDREPGLEVLELIADYFNCDVDYLLGKSEMRNKALELTKSATPAANFSDERLDEFVSLFTQLTVEQQKLIISQIRGILSDR